jgi:hypothetical protein
MTRLVRTMKLYKYFESYKSISIGTSIVPWYRNRNRNRNHISNYNNHQNIISNGGSKYHDWDIDIDEPVSWKIKIKHNLNGLCKWGTNLTSIDGETERKRYLERDAIKEEMKECSEFPLHSSPATSATSRHMSTYIQSREKDEKEKAKEIDESNTKNEVIENDSRVGAAMSDLTTRRVIILVLTMLLAVPFLLGSSMDYAPRYATQFVANMEVCYNINSSNDACAQGLKHAIQRAVDIGCVSIIKKDMTTTTTDSSSTTDSTYTTLYYDAYYMSILRDVEVVIESSSNESEGVQKMNDISSISYNSTTSQIIAVFDIQYQSQSAAIISLYLTIFVILLLGFGTYILSTDVNVLVIRYVHG